MEGQVVDADAMDFSVEVRLANCDGGFIACGLLGAAGIEIPCSTYITTQASPQ